MPVRVQCGGCGARLQVPDTSLGKKLKCPRCASFISVAGPAAPGVSGPDAAGADRPRSLLPAPPMPGKPAAFDKAAPEGTVPVSAPAPSRRFTPVAIVGVLVMAAVGAGLGYWRTRTGGGKADIAPADWRRFGDPAARFEADFPGAPGKSVSAHKGLLQRSYSVRNGPYEFEATWAGTELVGDRIITVDRVSTLTNMLTRFPGSAPPAESLGDLSGDDVSRDFLIASDRGATFVRLRFIGPDSYILAVSGPSVTKDAPAAQRFLNSFKRVVPVEMRSEREQIKAAAESGDIPKLISFLKAGTRDEAVRRLVRIGAPAVPALTEALARNTVRSGAAEALGRIGRPSLAAAPALGALLKERESDVRYAAVVALKSIRPEPGAFVPLLADVVADRATEGGGAERQVQTAAISALWEIGSQDLPSLTALAAGRKAAWVPMMTTLARTGGLPDGGARLLALLGLESAPTLLTLQRGGVPLELVGKMGVEAVAALLEACERTDDDNERHEMGSVLIKIVKASDRGRATALLAARRRAAIQTLRRCHQNSGESRMVVELLTAMGPEAAPALIAVFSRNDNVGIPEALRSLGDPGLAALLAGLKDDEGGRSRASHKQQDCAWILGEIGPAAAAAAPALLEMALSPAEEATFNGVVVTAFLKVCGRDKARIAELVKPHANFPAAVLRAYPLSDGDVSLLLEPFGAAAAPPLIELLRGRYGEDNPVFRALRSLGEAALPALTDSLKEGANLPSSCRLLAALGARADPPFPAVSAAVGRAGPGYRDGPFLAMARIRPKESVPKLLEYLETREDGGAAAIALGAAVRSEPSVRAELSAEVRTKIVAKMLPLLDHRGSPVAAEAAEALLSFPDPAAHRLALRALGSDGVSARAILIKMGAAAIPGVVAASGVCSRDDRAELARVLKSLPAEGVGAAFAAALDDPDQRRQAAGLLAGAALAGPPKEAVPAIIGRLAGDDQIARYEAAKALGNLGPQAGPAVSAALEAASKDKFPAVSTAATEALARIRDGK